MPNQSRDIESRILRRIELPNARGSQISRRWRVNSTFLTTAFARLSAVGYLSCKRRHIAEWMHLPTVIVNCLPIPGDRIRPAPLLKIAGSNWSRPCSAVSVTTTWLKSLAGGVYLELAYNSILPSPELLRVCSHKGWIGVAGLEILLKWLLHNFSSG